MIEKPDLKLLKGKKRTEKPTTTLIQKPDFLSAGASDYWDRIYPDLSDAKIIGVLDADALAMLCESHALYRQSLQDLQEHGAVSTNREGAMVRSPYFMIEQKAFEQFNSMLSEFGMSPKSRTKISTVSVVDTPPDGWDSF